MVLLKLAFILNDFPYHGTRYSGQEEASFLSLFVRSSVVSRSSEPRPLGNFLEHIYIRICTWVKPV